MKTLTLGFVTMAFLAISGCMTTAQFAPARVGEAYPVRTVPTAIELFRSSSPTKKYLEIGAVSGCCSANANTMIDLLRQKASESGGDALIGLDMRANGGVTATVIRYQ